MTSDSKASDMNLFAPITLGPYALANRMVMAPMTRNRAGPGNVPQEMNATYYAQRASAGLIVTEATQVSPQGVGYPNTPGIHSEEQVKGWRKITRAVHEQGSHIFLQLWHVGRISHPALQPDGALPVAPSAVKPDGDVYTYEGPQPFVTPRALATAEIPGIVTQFRDGARLAQKAGFDGVELHAANGYLIDQFLRDGTNLRDDAYGGSLENRARFLLEVTEAVVGVWGAERVGVRLSPLSSFNSMSDSNPLQTFSYAAERLSEYGLAYLHVVEFPSDDPGQTLDFFALRRAFQGLYIANGGYDFERATQVVQSGRADLVSFARLFLANPDLPRRFASRAPLNTPDPGSFYGGDRKGYIDYPTLDG